MSASVSVNESAAWPLITRSLASIEPGRYRLRVAGLAPDVENMDSFLVIKRPVEKLKMVLAILGIIASSALALGGLIGSLATLVKFQSG